MFCCGDPSSGSRAMFCNGLRESHEERVEIKGVHSETMSVLLDYTYTSRAHLTHANVQRILEAASQFQVHLNITIHFNLSTYIHLSQSQKSDELATTLNILKLLIHSSELVELPPLCSSFNNRTCC